MNKIMRITYDYLDNVCMIQRKDGSIRTYPKDRRFVTLMGIACKTPTCCTDSYPDLPYKRYTEWRRLPEIIPGFFLTDGGNLIITADPSEMESLDYCISLAEDKGWNAAGLEYWGEIGCNSTFEYHPNAGDAGIAMFSGPVFVERVYYPEDDPRYNANDDDLGIDWEASRVWYFDYYAYESPLEALKRDGYVVFNGVNKN